MSSTIRVETARIGKFFGKECAVGEDVTDSFDPLNHVHMNMLGSGSVKLVKVEDNPPKTVTKTATRSKSK